MIENLTKLKENQRREEAAKRQRDIQKQREKKRERAVSEIRVLEKEFLELSKPEKFSKVIYNDENKMENACQKATKIKVIAQVHNTAELINDTADSIYEEKEEDLRKKLQSKMELRKLNKDYDKIESITTDIKNKERKKGNQNERTNKQEKNGAYKNEGHKTVEQTETRDRDPDLRYFESRRESEKKNKGNSKHQREENDSKRKTTTEDINIKKKNLISV